MIFDKLWKKKERPAVSALPAVKTATEQSIPKKRRKQDFSRLTRNRCVTIRLTEQEVKLFKAAAARHHLCMADYIMCCVKEERIVMIPGAARLRTELLREGRNLNYALMLANSARKEGKPVDIQMIQSAIKKVDGNLDRLSKLIIKWDADITEEMKEVGGSCQS